MKPVIHPCGAFGALYEVGAGYEGKRDELGRLYLQPLKAAPRICAPNGKPVVTDEMRRGALVKPDSIGLVGQLTESAADKAKRQQRLAGSI
ncbi:hypothetical protein [Caldimonas tepidiphila]|uniref:hypothetical protein n=1 Tax=Caldimonas tepidiphila TaxID=2315841 RepID=UPI000E5AA31D|nr:hypothetical protein [Caldimonas tepidiphila]